MNLNTVNKSLEIKLAGAAATTELPWIAGYTDVDQTALTVTAMSETDGVTTGATPVVAAAAPGAGITRRLTDLSVTNVDTAAVLLTVQVDNAATKRINWRGTLAVGDVLTFSEKSGFLVTDTNGSAKTMLGGIIPAANFPALTGDVTTTQGSLVTTIGAAKVTNAMLAGSIAASKLVGTDIATVGTITSGVWNAGAVTSSGTITGVAGTFSGLLTVSGAGLTNIAGNSGANQGLSIRNTGTVGNAAFLLDVDNAAVGNGLAVQAFPAASGTSGAIMPNAGAIRVLLAAGLNLASEHASGPIRLFSGGLTRRALYDTDGTVTFDIYGAGTATFSAAGKFSSVSDERLKNINGPLGYGLKEVLQLNPIRYFWNGLSGLDDPKHTEYGGFGAANVKAVMPLAVGMDGRGYLTLADRPILAATVIAIQELNARLVALETRIH
jgi:hypothetical protein